MTGRIGLSKHGSLEAKSIRMALKVLVVSCATTISLMALTVSQPRSRQSVDSTLAFRSSSTTGLVRVLRLRANSLLIVL